jgi:hypothetical protein
MSRQGRLRPPPGRTGLSPDDQSGLNGMHVAEFFPAADQRELSILGLERAADRTVAGNACASTGATGWTL